MSASKQYVCPQCGSGEYESLSWKAPEEGGHPYGRKCKQCGTRYATPPSKLAAIRWFAYATFFFLFGLVTGVLGVMLLIKEGFFSPWFVMIGFTAALWPCARSFYRTGRSAFR